MSFDKVDIINEESVVSIEAMKEMHTKGGKNFAIFAQDTSGLIGANNDLLWYLPEDLSFFKHVTLNNNVIMGKNTWLSLPFKPLPKRNNIIISSTLNDVGDLAIKVKNVDKAMNIISNNGYNFFIGGSQVYDYILSENIVDGIYMTIVDFVEKDDNFSPFQNFGNIDNVVYAPVVSNDYVLCAETDWEISENGYMKYDTSKKKIKYKILFYRQAIRKK